MTDLCKLFIQIVSDTEGLDASNYRPHRLKKRLQKSFPQLYFHWPFARSKSEFVFSEELTSGELAERHDIVDKYNCESGSESNNEDDVEKVIVKPVYASDYLLHLYRSAMTLQNFVKNAPPFAPKWPPDASDITLENALENVPIALFNSMA